ncbi:ImpA family type VI secretion system protein [Thiomonas sp. FB-6]|uniref:type VI secretion system protein TssA n=1 Tax=Thiomonas sp. FB-6 TaxID=1158291 RepID=UPI00036A7E7D|nr:type VI secretion system ImpA family N-terminal domain-containing protein [Thiomonas sp. FB-6]
MSSPQRRLRRDAAVRSARAEPAAGKSDTSDEADTSDKAWSPAASPDESAGLPAELRAWLQPLPGSCPAGPCLEYTTEYAALQARMAAPVEVQYGNFTQRREAPPWREVERECHALLQRSRDITLLVWWLRCRVHNAGALGLEQGLYCIVQLLRRFGEHLHPQARVDGEHDPAMRANALALLGDAEGLMADVRELVALRTPGGQQRVRDVERALTADASAREALHASLARSWIDEESERRALGGARAALAELLAWAHEDLGGAAPDLGPLQRLLEPFAPPAPAAPEAPDAPSPDKARNDGEPAPPDGPMLQGPSSAAAPAAQGDEAPASPQSAKAAAQAGAPAPGTAAPREPGDRQAAQASIALARAWFERNEPSSPVCVLLRQAERLVGKRYAEVVQAIPAELLARWESP